MCYTHEILVWGFEYQRLVKLQKRCIRTICCAKYNAHTEPLFKSLNLMKIEDIFTCQALKFYYKYVHDKLPRYFSNLLSYNSFYHDYPTRQQTNLHLAVSRTSQSSLCLRHYLPKLIQTLPSCVIDKVFTHSFPGFVYYMKWYYMEKYNADCYIENCYICRNLTN